MKVFLKNFEVVYPGHSKHGKFFDFVFHKGKLIDFKKKLSKPKDTTHTFEDGSISPAFVDVGCHLSDPGFEHRETLETLSASALAGGFSDLIVFPNTEPCLDSASAISSVLSRSSALNVNLHVCGAITSGAEGDTLAELNDMSHAGAIAFSDGSHSIQHEGQLYRALQYAKSTNKPIINQSKLKSLNANWQMNEGSTNITLGLIGQNSQLETIAAQRDLGINAYANGNLILHKVSSPNVVSLVGDYKKHSQVACTVSYKNLIATEDKLLDFDSNWKLDPPLRSEKERIQLVKQVNKGNIDMIVSDHMPIDREGKVLELSQAEFGAIGLQTVLSALLTFAPKLDLDAVVDCLAVKPRKQFELPLPKLEKDTKDSFTIFDKLGEYVFDNNASLSQNSPFLDQTFTGKILGIFTGGKCVLNE